MPLKCRVNRKINQGLGTNRNSKRYDKKNCVNIQFTDREKRNEFIYCLIT